MLWLAVLSGWCTRTTPTASAVILGLLLALAFGRGAGYMPLSTLPCCPMLWAWLASYGEWLVPPEAVYFERCISVQSRGALPARSILHLALQCWSMTMYSAAGVQASGGRR